MSISQQVQKKEHALEKQRSSLTIQQENFECFQNLQCLKQNNPFKNSNLDEVNLNQNRSERFVIEGSAKNESIYAVYNHQGDLVKATVIQRNIALPQSVVNSLISGEFNDWKIVGNEVVIENFDAEQIQYKVVLENDSEIRMEYFDRNGQPLNRFL